MLERKTLAGLKLQQLFAMPLAVCVLFFSGIVAAEEYEMKGRVVYFGGSVGIPKVKVEVKYSKEGVPRITRETNGNGEYSFKVPVYQERVWITYTPENPSDLTGAARDEGVPNSANPKDLDTIGLVRKRQACGDKVAARTAAWNSLRYVMTGGQPTVAEQFFKGLYLEKCSMMVEVLKEDQSLAQALRMKGIRTWTE